MRGHRLRYYMCPIHPLERADVAKKRTSEDGEQHDRFAQAARELECDDDPERFKETVRKLASAPPAPAAKREPKKVGR